MNDLKNKISSMKKIFFLVSTCFLMLIAISGCGPSRVVVRERPLAPIYSRPGAPGPNYVWVEGEWIRHRNNYVYRRGYWAHQRYGHMYYIPGKWISDRNGWVWSPGHWR